MTPKGKHEQLVDEVIQEEALLPDKAGKLVIPVHHEIGINALNPHFIDIGMNIEPHATGYGELMIFPNTGVQTRSFAHKHAVVETLHWIGTNSENPDDLGGTVEFWLGKGAEAEAYIIIKPTTLLLPPNTVQFPLYVREVHSPFVLASSLNTPLWAGLPVREFPSGFTHILDKK